MECLFRPHYHRDGVSPFINNNTDYESECSLMWIFWLSLLYLNSENLSLALSDLVAFGSFWVLFVQADTTAIQCIFFINTVVYLLIVLISVRSDIPLLVKIVIKFLCLKWLKEEELNRTKASIYSMFWSLLAIFGFLFSGRWSPNNFKKYCPWNTKATVIPKTMFTLPKKKKKNPA